MIRSHPHSTTIITTTTTTTATAVPCSYSRFC